MKLTCFSLSCLLLLCFGACGDNYLYETTKEIPNGVWTYRDTLNFQFDIADTSARYNLYVEFAHADTFPHQNLYLRLKTRFPDGRRVSDVKSFDFFSAQGVSNGTCSNGKCRVQLNLKQKTRFPQPGTYAITFEQYMRRDSVPGVASIGMAIEKIKKP